MILAFTQIKEKNITQNENKNCIINNNREQIISLNKNIKISFTKWWYTFQNGSTKDPNSSLGPINQNFWTI